MKVRCWAVHRLLADEPTDLLLQLGIGDLVAVVAHGSDEEVLALGEHRREHGHDVAADKVAVREVPGQILGRIVERDATGLDDTSRDRGAGHQISMLPAEKRQPLSRRSPGRPRSSPWPEIIWRNHWATLRATPTVGYPGSRDRAPTRPAPGPGHDDLRRDVGAGRRTGAINLGQGFPDTDGPSEVPTPRSPPSGPATTSTRPGSASPTLRQAVAEHQAALLGPRLRPRHRDPGDGGATEAMTAAVLGAVRAR